MTDPAQTVREAAIALLDAMSNVGIVASDETAGPLHIAIANLRTALAEETAEGMVMAPREPTEAMLLAGTHATHNPRCYESSRYTAAAVYAAMLSATKEP